MSALTTTAMRNPAFLGKVRVAIYTAHHHACSSPSGHGKAYVANRKGANVLRIDMTKDGRLTAWGDLSRNVTARVMDALAA